MNPYIRFVDEPLLRLASRISDVWYRTTRTAPPRQKWIALIVFFVPILVYNCAIFPRTVHDLVLPGAGPLLSLLMLFTSIAMLVVASAQLKGIPNIWDAQRYKLALTAAAAQVSTGRIVRVVFPLTGLSNLVSVALRTSHDGTGSLITAEIGLWFIALASVSYLMACEPPKPDDGDGFEYLPSAAP